MRNGYTSEQIMAGVKAHADIEMYLFDSLHPAVRTVMVEHPAPVFLRQLFRDDPGAYQFAQQNPHLFAQKLRAFMDRNHAANAERSRAEIRRMMKELSNA